MIPATNAPVDPWNHHAAFCPWHVNWDDVDCRCGHVLSLPPEDERRKALPAGTYTDDHAIAPTTDDGGTYANGNDARRGNWQQVFTGRQFWPIDPRADEVDIRDIAHALSLQCRYAGHCERFYSVAEHSVLVSHVVPRELALMGLLHDATEAYVIDVPRPLKPFLTGYAEIERNVWIAIADRFGLPHDMPREIKDADNAVLLKEAEEIMKPHPAPWCIPGRPAKVKINCLAPGGAERLFLARFNELTA